MMEELKDRRNSQPIIVDFETRPDWNLLSASAYLLLELPAKVK